MSPNDRRKIRALRVITLIGIALAFMFALIYAWMAQWRGSVFGVAIAVILVLCRLGIRKGIYRATYFAGAGVLTLTFLFILATGTGAPDNISWFYILPLVFFIFLELAWATVFLAGTTGALFVLLIRPELLHTHGYDTHLVLRFFVVYALISLVAWAYEATRKEYEAELARQNEEIRAQKDFSSILLETIPNPIFYKDRMGRYLGCNRAFEELLGLPRARIIGNSVFEVFPEEVAPEYHERDRALMETPGKQRYESRVIPPNGGETREVVFHKSTFRDNRGKVQGIIGVVFDVSEQKKAEGERIRLIQELETALAEIKTLSGMLPICSSCKKIRDDQGYWQQLETYIETHSQALFSHSICPVCSKALYGDQPWFKKLGEDSD